MHWKGNASFILQSRPLSILQEMESWAWPGTKAKALRIWLYPGSQEVHVSVGAVEDVIFLSR